MSILVLVADWVFSELLMGTLPLNFSYLLITIVTLLVSNAGSQITAAGVMIMRLVVERSQEALRALNVNEKRNNVKGPHGYRLCSEKVRP